MKIKQQLITLSIAAFLLGCDEGQDPSFMEKERSLMVLEIGDKSGDALPDGSLADHEGWWNQATSILDITALEEADFEESLLSEADGDMATAEPSKSDTNTADNDHILSDSNTSDGTNTSGGNDGYDEKLSGDVAKCAKDFGISKDKVIVAGSKSSERKVIETDAVVAIRLTGNQNAMDLVLQSPAESPLKGLCVFLAGNQSEIKIDILSNLGALIYYGRGNQSKGELNIGSGVVVRQMFTSLSGNGSSLAVKGASLENCSAFSARGNGSNFDCQ